MIQKKVCILGEFGVGKTSLVARFVKNEFSDKYLTTVGVKMDTKVISMSLDLQVKLILWDIAGESQLNSKTTSYLRGSAGFVFVADGTRENTLTTVLNLKQEADNLLGDIPRILLINKYDLVQEWLVSEAEIEALRERGWHIFYSSAKTGENVEEALFSLVQKLI